MDIIITAVGEFIWTTSCAVVNFCVSSGVSVIAIFISFLCAILASAFYKYTISHKPMSYNDTSNILNDECKNNDLDKSATITTTPITTDSSLTTPLIPIPSVDITTNANNLGSLTEIEINIEENTNENERKNNYQQTSDDILIDTIEGSEEEIQKQQIANIYRLLNDQNLINNWTTTDFLDQLKMYGLHEYDEDELHSE